MASVRSAARGSRTGGGSCAGGTGFRRRGQRKRAGTPSARAQALNMPLRGIAHTRLRGAACAGAPDVVAMTSASYFQMGPALYLFCAAAPAHSAAASAAAHKRPCFMPRRVDEARICVATRGSGMSSFGHAPRRAEAARVCKLSRPAVARTGARRRARCGARPGPRPLQDVGQRCWKARHSSSCSRASRAAPLRARRPAHACVR
jgi:hypothetical protein